MKKLPIGIQDFSKIIEGNYLYVDKTKYLLEIMNEGTFLFFNRPRRFGKSLICSKLYYLYKGKKELFNDLYIYNKVDWESVVRPVVNIDFSNMNLEELSLQRALEIQMANICTELGLESQGAGGSRDFQYILEYFGQRGTKVVVIIDEYDKALTDFLDDHLKFNKHIDLLRGFYGILKANDKNLEKVFITGISKYGKVSIFSALNNLSDITLNDEYVSMCGYTQAEIEINFTENLEKVALRFQKPLNDLLQELKLRYNGYSFDGVNTVYNPYAILCFLRAKEFKNFWFDTGLPYFLIDLLKKEQISVDTLENIQSDISTIGIAEIDNQSVVSLLFQTGYLTIKKATRLNFDLLFELDFPNIEVKQSFSQYLLVVYFQRGLDIVANKISEPIRKYLLERDIPGVIRVLQEQVYPNVPYQLYENKEAFYHTIFHVSINTAGFRTQSEVQTNIGRIDMVVETYDTIFIFEFKLDQKTSIGLNQIKERLYYQKYLHLGYPIFAVSINFSSESRNIVEYEVLKIKGSSKNSFF